MFEWGEFDGISGGCMNGEVGSSIDDDGDFGFELAGRDAHDSDLMWGGDVFIPRHDSVFVADGGVCAPPVTILDELDSSPSLSKTFGDGFSSWLPWIYNKKK